MAKRKTKNKKEVSNMEENDVKIIEESNEKPVETEEIAEETVEEPVETEEIAEEVSEEPVETEEIAEETVEEPVETEEIAEETIEEVQENTEEPIVENIKIGKVLPNKLNVRENPDKSANILKVLDRNDEVEILEELELFYKIKINDTIGYCVKEFIV
jgi:hypothetical protein